MELENGGRRLDPALTYYNQCCDLLLAVLVWIHRVTKERRIHLCRHSQPLCLRVFICGYIKCTQLILLYTRYRCLAQLQNSCLPNAPFMVFAIIFLPIG